LERLTIDRAWDFDQINSLRQHANKSTLSKYRSVLDAASLLPIRQVAVDVWPRQPASRLNSFRLDELASNDCAGKVIYGPERAITTARDAGRVVH
jgi:hypothetical protein